MKATKEQQVIALRYAIEMIKYAKLPFICIEVSCGLYDDFEYVPACDVHEYVPLLTFENAQLVCRKYKLKMPIKGNDSGGWWNSGIKKPRLAFVNWMIKELKK